MSKDWIKLDDWIIKIDQVPAYLDRFNLLPSLLRKFIEAKYTSSIKPTKEEQQSYYQNFLNKNKITNSESLDDWLKKRGLDEVRMTRMLYDSLKVERLKYQKFEGKVDSIFLRSKESLDRAMYSIIRVKSKNEINELHLKLVEDDAIFSELASEYSQGPEKNVNGILGPHELGQLNIDLSERLRSSKKGQLWPPFESQGWWVLLRLEKFIPAQLDKKMKERIINELYENWMKDNIVPLLQSIRQNNQKSSITENNREVDNTTQLENKGQSLYSLVKKLIKNQKNDNQNNDKNQNI